MVIVPLTKFIQDILGIWASPIIVWSPSVKLEVYSDSEISTLQFMSRASSFYLHKCRMLRITFWHLAYPYVLTTIFWILALPKTPWNCPLLFPSSKQTLRAPITALEVKKSGQNITDPPYLWQRWSESARWGNKTCFYRNLSKIITFLVRSIWFRGRKS